MAEQHKRKTSTRVKKKKTATAKKKRVPESGKNRQLAVPASVNADKPRFPNLEQSSELSIVQQAAIEQLNLEFMETMGAMFFKTLFPNGMRLNHHSDEWPDIVITVKDNNIILDARNIPPSFKLPAAASPDEMHELLSVWKMTLQMEGQTVIEFGHGVHGVYFDKSTATRVMLRNMLSRILPGLKP